MNSLALGNSISPVEVTHVSSHGVWLLTQSEELFMSYDDFPWFKNQSIQAVFMSRNRRPIIFIGRKLMWI